MSQPFCDIKRYNLDPVFLLRMTRQVVADQGWVIKQEYKSEIVASVQGLSGYPNLVVTVNVCHGYITLSIETDEEHYFYTDQWNIAERFFQTINKRISEVPAKQRKTIKESYGLSFR